MNKNFKEPYLKEHIDMESFKDRNERFLRYVDSTPEIRKLWDDIGILNAQDREEQRIKRRNKLIKIFAFIICGLTMIYIKIMFAWLAYK